MKHPMALAGILWLAASLVGCGASSPTPTPTPERWPYLSREVRLYLIEIEPYTSAEAIFTAPHLPAAELERIVSKLEEIVPPPELREAHGKLVDGYRYLHEGRAILETHPRPELRSEGFFLQDWGIKTPREHQEMVLEFVENQRLK